MATFIDGEGGASVRAKINAAITTVDGLGSGDNLLMTAAQSTKLGHITVTGSVDLDALATEGYVDTAIAGLVDSSPAALDTLNELAAALGDDPNFATTISGQIGAKLDAAAVSAFALTLLDDADAATARTTLGLATVASTGAFADLADVNAGTPTDGDIMVWRDGSSAWVKEAKPAGGSNPAINDVTDITITTPADNEVLAYDDASSEWINMTAAEAGLLTSVPFATVADIHVGTEAAEAVSPDTMLDAGAPVALTDGATITPDFAAGRVFTVTLGGNRTLAAPTNQAPGQSGMIVVTQDGTGSRTLTFNSAYKFESGSKTLSTAAGAIDVVSYYVQASGTILCSLGKGFA